MRAYAAGADDYVVKPFDPYELCSRVRLHFRLRGASGYHCDDRRATAISALTLAAVPKRRDAVHDACPRRHGDGLDQSRRASRHGDGRASGQDALLRPDYRRRTRP